LSSRRHLLREVNERIREVNASFGPESPSHEILLCECGREGCAERLEVPRDVYEVIFRDVAQRFLVAPGHEEPAQEQVVAGAPSYLVVALRPQAL
jgi:hypothetical protein